MRFSEQERLDRLQLARSDGVGPIRFQALLSRFGAAAAALAALPRLSESSGRPLRRADRKACEKELAATARFGAALLFDGEGAYPEWLRPLPDRPPVLCVKGDAKLPARRCVAIIGARNASTAGRKLARLFAEGLGAGGVAVVSGLARGIDGAAHEATLATGAIAVVAGGVDIVYPPEHEALTQAIAEQGLLLSERPLGWRPTARDFPRRNRLISGLSRAVVVVEAAAQSGTLITARFALEQGRDVFAAPGSPLDPRCAGSNRLIRDGALLVQSADDILEGIAEPRSPFAGAAPQFRFDEEGADLTPEFRTRLYEALSYTPVHRDDLIRDLDAPAGLVADALLDLLLAGEAEEHAGGRFARAR